MHLLSASDLSMGVRQNILDSLCDLSAKNVFTSTVFPGQKCENRICINVGVKWTCIQAMHPLLFRSYYVTITRAAFKNSASQEWARCHIQLLSFLFFYRWINEWRWRSLSGFTGNLSSRELKWWRMLRSRWYKDTHMQESTHYVGFLFLPVI